MKPTSLGNLYCSIARALDVVGDWWSPLIVRDAWFGVRRFDDFHHRLGIPRNTLTSRLEKLVERGVLERRPQPDQPARFEYALTEKGADLYLVLWSLARWGDRWEPTGLGPPMQVRHRACGEVVDPVVSCSHCGRALVPADLEPVPGPGGVDPAMLPPGSRGPAVSRDSR